MKRSLFLCYNKSKNEKKYNKGYVLEKVKKTLLGADAEMSYEVEALFGESIIS